MAKKQLSQTKAEPPFKAVNNLLDKISLFRNFRSSKTFYIILIIAGVLLLAIYKKSWFVAATVNGSPITNLELQIRLNRDFRAKALDQLITEKIILSEAAKNNAVASDIEVNNKISEAESIYGGAQALDTLLAQQGQTRKSVKQSIKLQLSMEKLYSKDATISAEEVDKFIEQNKAFLQATDSAGQQKEAYDGLKSQKLSQIFSQKFQELKTKAKIQLF